MNTMCGLGTKFFLTLISAIYLICAVKESISDVTSLFKKNEKIIFKNLRNK